jgi:Beta-xylosidase
MFKKAFTLVIIMSIIISSVAAFPAIADDPSETFQNPIVVPNQWTAPNGKLYGTGDPYILKHNGIYYLYASTQDSRWGFRIWTSRDLVNWEWAADCNTEATTNGQREDDSNSRFQGAYAPEVYYRGGKFWLLTSRDQRNQRVYVSDSPLGPFTYKYQYPFPGVGNEIDGHIFIDDNGQKHFFSATGSKIRRALLSDSGDDLFKTVSGSSEMNDLTVSNKWTEAPTVFKRKDMYYMTYCGNHVISPTYRIEYAMGTSIANIREAGVGGDNMLICSTDGEYVGPVITGGGTTISTTQTETKKHHGLGHNGIVVGPDLDTYYMAYHNLAGDFGVGPYRNYNLDRIVFADDGKMSVLGPTTWAQDVPARPDFEYVPETDDLEDFFDVEDTGNAVWGKPTAPEDYTAEINFVPESSGDMGFVSIIFGSHEISISPSARTISYKDETKLLSADFKFDTLHTAMVKSHNGETRLFLDGQQLFKDSASGAGGSIGVLGDFSEIGYTAISGAVYGSKDDEIKFPTDSKIPAESAATNAASFKTFGTGDTASYMLNKQRDGLHSINISAKSVKTAVMKVSVREDSEEAVEVGRFSVGNTGGKYQAFTLRGVSMGAGVDEVIVECIVGEVDFKNISVFKDDTPAAAVSGVGSFNKILGAWAKSDGDKTIETSDGGKYSIAHMGTEWWSDYTVSAKLRRGAGSDSGLLLRARYLSDTPERGLGADNDLDYHYGYYITFDNSRVMIAKQKFGWSGWLKESGVKAIDITQEHILKVTMIGPRIQIWLDGELRLDFVDMNDPILNGKVTLRSRNDKAYYSDFSVEPTEAPEMVVPEFPHTVPNALVALNMASGANGDGIMIYAAASSLGKEDKAKINAADALQILKNGLQL